MTGDSEQAPGSREWEVAAGNVARAITTHRFGLSAVDGLAGSLLVGQEFSWEK
jgi:hypothetical protein